MSVAPAPVTADAASANRSSPHPKWPPKSGAHKKKGYWARVRRKQKKQGVIEIDCRHPRYDRVNLIRKGLQKVLGDNPDHGAKDSLGPDDFSQELKIAIKSGEEGQDVEFVSYAPCVFSTLRRAMGISEEDFKQAIAPEALPYLEFISNSKSGQDFYISNDQAYFMKTERVKFVRRFLRDLLGRYLQHFLKYPHSLVVKYLGLYSLAKPGKKKVYIFTMQSIFFPQDRIERRFDLKGCSVNRYQKPPDKNEVTIYKDQNLGDFNIELGPQANWLSTQLAYDVDFLRSLGSIDYSLLLGYQKRHDNERDQHLGDIVTRVKQSIKHAGSDFHTDGSTTSIIRGSQDPLCAESPAHAVMKSPLHAPNGLTMTTLNFVNQDDMEENIAAHNLRLLPRSKNPLHTIDGPHVRYYVGVIDFFMTYGIRHRFERLLKAMLRCSCDHSTREPEFYAQRFLDSITDIIR